MPLLYNMPSKRAKRKRVRKAEGPGGVSRRLLKSERRMNKRWVGGAPELLEARVRRQSLAERPCACIANAVVEQAARARGTHKRERTCERRCVLERR